MIKPINSKVTAKPIIKIKTTCTAVVPYQALLELIDEFNLLLSLLNFKNQYF